MDIFVFNKSLKYKIHAVLSYKDGPNTFLQKAKKLKQQYKKDTKNFFSIVAIMKNEGPYLKEWIEYHRIIGTEKFYLYDNESTDNTKEILEPYIKSGIVEYTFMPGERMQFPAYAHFKENYGDQTRWVAVIDLDEFIVAKKQPLLTYLKKHSDASQIIVPWVFFGSNGHLTKPDGLVIENYTKRAKKPRLYKSIVNPQLTLDMQCHDHIVAGKTIFPKKNTLMINHYYCKSLEEYKRRKKRGDAINGKVFAEQTFNDENFREFDINEQSDTFILQYADKIKDKLK